MGWFLTNNILKVFVGRNISISDYILHIYMKLQFFHSSIAVFEGCKNLKFAITLWSVRDTGYKKGLSLWLYRQK